jgi:hypothetical protein
VLNIAALLLAAASAGQSPALVSSASWWEKVTVTVSGDGKAQGCTYQSSLGSAQPSSCEVEEGQASVASRSSGEKSQLTRITFERRFVPSGTEPDTKLQPGDTLLGGSLMALAIAEDGAVANCQVVAKSGDVTPTYGCDEAQAERFEANAGRKVDEPRGGYMMVLVYGHEENVA